jgi:hypothetical protein
MRSMVEGAHLSAASTVGPFHHAASRRCPPPRSGEELLNTLDRLCERNAPHRHARRERLEKP